MYLLTIEDILGSAGLKDVTKGVRSFHFGYFCLLDQCAVYIFYRRSTGGYCNLA